MKKVLPIVLLFMFVFAAENQEAGEPFVPRVSTEGDIFTDPNPLMQQLIQAKRSNDLETYNQLLKEYISQLPDQPTNTPSVYAEKVEPPLNGPIMRWGDDIIIYGGNVFYNAWSMLTDVDDEAISVDYHRGDTLIAAVACTDSLIRAFKSYDNGLTWYFVFWMGVTDYALSEPEIFYGSNGLWWHMIARSSSNNGDLVCFNVEGDQSAWNAEWIEVGADSAHRFTVCSDKTDWSSIYWLYLAFHKGLGGVGQDEIWFTRGLSYGTSWDTPTGLQFSGSGFPDLAYGDDLLYEAYLYRSGTTKNMHTRRSTNLGTNWLGSVVVHSDTTTKQGPQIAASNDGSDDAWVIWPRRDPLTATYDYGIMWSWCQNAGATWSSPGYINSIVGYHELLPSIAVFDQYGADSWYPYVTFIRSVDDWSDPFIYSFNWLSDSTWGTAVTYNDSVPEFVRPIQTWDSDIGSPAFAYVGDGGDNVYFDSWGNVAIAENENKIPTKGLLSQNVPNPFVSTTRFVYSIPVNSMVDIRVFNALGQEVVTLVHEQKAAGTYTFTWNGVDNKGVDLPRGVYFLKLEAGNLNATRKMIIE